MHRRLLSLMAAAILAAPAAHAQGMGAMHHERTDSAAHAQMMAKLNLTEAQKTQIKAIHDKYSAQMKGDHHQSGMAGMDSMRGMDPTMKQAMAEVRAVLTPEQQTQFDGMVAEHERKHHAMDDTTSHHSMKMPPGSMPR